MESMSRPWVSGNVMAMMAMASAGPIARIVNPAGRLRVKLNNPAPSARLAASPETLALPAQEPACPRRAVGNSSTL